MTENKKFIDIERVISEKNPKLLKWLPGFVVRYLKRTLNEENVNTFIAENKDKNSFEFCNQVIQDFDISLTTYGLENVPEKGGCVLAVNHPLGGMDAMALVTLLQEKRKDIKFIVNDVLMNLENLKELFVGVNLVGKNAKTSLKKVDELFATEQLICLFPAGLVSRRPKKDVVDLAWKKTFVTRAKKYKKPIIPVHINGELSNFFYRLSNIRKRLGIKANIEMLYLVNELYKQKGKKMNVVFGKIIPTTSLSDEKSDHDWAQEIKEKAYKLAK